MSGFNFVNKLALFRCREKGEENFAPEQNQLTTSLLKLFGV
jgi:hypothetical protein